VWHSFQFRDNVQEQMLHQHDLSLPAFKPSLRYLCIHYLCFFCSDPQ
ncbi:6792_t:CDS:1, partial [Gigaspora rosea]